MVKTASCLLRLLLLLTAFGASMTLHAAGPAAIVTDLRGDVRASSGARLDLLAELAVGAELAMASGAQVTIVHLATQSTYSLTGPGSFAIRASGVEGQGGAKVASAKALSASYQGVRLQPARIAQASIAMRGAATEDRLRLISPVASWLLEPQPVFTWSASVASSRYTLQLTDAENRVLFDTVTSATSAKLPAEVALEPGRLYGWQVKAMLPNGQELEAWAEFGVADAALRSRIEAARPRPDAATSERVLFALLLESLNAHTAAQQEWAHIARERPHEAKLRAVVERQ